MESEYHTLTLEEVLARTQATQESIDTSLSLMADISQQLWRAELASAVQQGCCGAQSLQETRARLMEAMETAEANVNRLFDTMKNLNARRAQLL